MHFTYNKVKFYGPLIKPYKEIVLYSHPHMLVSYNSVCTPKLTLDKMMEDVERLVWILIGEGIFEKDMPVRPKPFGGIILACIRCGSNGTSFDNIPVFLLQTDCMCFVL